MGDNTAEPNMLHGYHGTSLQCANVIVAEKRFHPSTKSSEWMGDGIYFFENDKQEALNWGKYKIRSCNPVAIECTIRSHKLLDMFVKENQLNIAKLIEAIANKYKDENREPEILDALVINMVCAETGYDVVRGPFKLKSQIFERLKDFTRFTRQHVQLCVRTNNCIDWDSMKGWDLNGCEIWKH